MATKEKDSQPTELNKMIALYFEEARRHSADGIIIYVESWLQEKGFHAEPKEISDILTLLIRDKTLKLGYFLHPSNNAPFACIELQD